MPRSPQIPRPGGGPYEIAPRPNRGAFDPASWKGWQEREVRIPHNGACGIYPSPRKRRFGSAHRPVGPRPRQIQARGGSPRARAPGTQRRGRDPPGRGHGVNSGHSQAPAIGTTQNGQRRICGVGTPAGSSCGAREERPEDLRVHEAPPHARHIGVRDGGHKHGIRTIISLGDDQGDH